MTSEQLEASLDRVKQDRLRQDEQEPEPEPTPLKEEEREAIAGRNDAQVNALLDPKCEDESGEPADVAQLPPGAADLELEPAPATTTLVDAKADEAERAAFVAEILNAPAPADAKHADPAHGRSESERIVAEALGPPEKVEQHEEKKGAPAAAAIEGNAGHWDQFLEAIAQNESGGRGAGHKGDDLVIGAGTIGASGMDASYGRYQTTADKALTVLRENPEAAKAEFGIDQAEVKELKGKLDATRSFWDLIMKDKASKVGKGQGSVTFTKADAALARTDPSAFIAKWKDDWHRLTGMDEKDLRHMLNCLKIRELTKNKIEDGPARKAKAKEIYEANQAFFDEMGMSAKDLTTFLKANVMAENLGGFHFKAAALHDDKLFKAVNRDAGEALGRLELLSVRHAVEKRSADLGIPIQNEEHLFMLCAKAHNAGTRSCSAEDFQTPDHLKGNKYVQKFLKNFEKAGSLAHVAAKGAAIAPAAVKREAKPAPPAAPSVATAAPAKATAAPAAAPAAKGPWWRFWNRGATPAKPNLSLWDRIRGKSVVDKLRERGLQIGARIGAREITPEQGAAELVAYDVELEGTVTPTALAMAAIIRNAVHDPKLNAQVAEHEVQKQKAVDASNASPQHDGPVVPLSPVGALATAGSAVHDGDASHGLGQGDEVFDEKGNVIQAFPSTPEGVVEAAFYELHRGDKRSLAEIMADTSKKKVQRGDYAATGGGDKFGCYTDDLDHVQAIGHVGAKSKHAKDTVYHSDLVMGGGALGPIQAYQMAGGFNPFGVRLGRAKTKEEKHDERKMWCGNFVTFCFARAGIHERSFAMAKDLGWIEAAFGGEYFKIDENDHMYGEGEVLHDEKLRRAKKETIQGQMRHEMKKLASLEKVDMRPGDHFHTGKHTGLIVAVHKTATRIDYVTIEGNVNDRVAAKHRSITLKDDGSVEAGNLREWARPPQFGAFHEVKLSTTPMPEWFKGATEVSNEPKKKAARKKEGADTNWDT